jgi:hypothetical protein
VPDPVWRCYNAFAPEDSDRINGGVKTLTWSQRGLFPKSASLTLLACFFLGDVPLRGQQRWEIPERQRHIQIDGFTDEWQGVPWLKLSPSSGDEGFKEGDVELRVQGLWDKENLYLAMHWTDDIWDIERVRRRDAVWLTPDRRRRDRTLFYDYLKFHIRRSDYDYTFWLTPRIESRGPFGWHRLLKGYKGMETATSAPIVTARQKQHTATLEVLFSWKEMSIKPKSGRTIPLLLTLADSDLPGTSLEMKLEQLKAIRWRGAMILAKTRR